MIQRTQTSAVECDLDGSTIIAILSDLASLPRWAPDFAPHVHVNSVCDGTVTRGGERFRLRVATKVGYCVDYLRTLSDGREGGAFMRVLPRPRGGSVVVMTVPIEPGSDALQVRAGMEKELERLILISTEADAAEKQLATVCVMDTDHG